MSNVPDGSVGLTIRMVNGTQTAYTTDGQHINGLQMVQRRDEIGKPVLIALEAILFDKDGDIVGLPK